jgi:hypothetical protein
VRVVGVGEEEDISSRSLSGDGGDLLLPQTRLEEKKSSLAAPLPGDGVDLPNRHRRWCRDKKMGGVFVGGDPKKER